MSKGSEGDRRLKMARSKKKTVRHLSTERGAVMPAQLPVKPHVRHLRIRNIWHAEMVLHISIGLTEEQAMKDLTLASEDPICSLRTHSPGTIPEMWCLHISSDHK